MSEYLNAAELASLQIRGLPVLRKTSLRKPNANLGLAADDSGKAVVLSTK